MVNQNETKKCPRCKEVKDLDTGYHYSSYTNNERQSRCKDCNNEIDKIKRQKYKTDGPTIIRTHKVCPTCKKDKPIDKFPKSKDKPDWHLTYCKLCWTEYVKARKAKL